MSIKIVSEKGGSLTLEVTIDLKGSFLEQEETILDACNEVGRLSTEKALETFDADGSAIQVGAIKYTSRCQSPKIYQTPYGAISVSRHVYQTSKGGKIYCPLESAARIIQHATPRFAKMLTNKYARMSAPETCEDLLESHHRKVSHSFVQNVAQVVSGIAQSKEESWTYQTPECDSAIKTVCVSVDGASLLMKDEGYRIAMVGSISLYDKEGERQHSIYVGAAPEYGKEHFFQRMKTEIEHIKQIYPDARYVGVADGAKDNWPFLEEHTQQQILDFYHASEYLCAVGEAAIPEKTGKQERLRWQEDRCHQLKHDQGAAQILLDEFKRLNRRKKISSSARAHLKSAITYFSNHLDLMNYADHVEQGLPIGSGVTEAACKVLIKQRFGRSGMRWKENGIKTVLSLRELVMTKARWTQFWNKLNQYGIPALP